MKRIPILAFLLLVFAFSNSGAQIITTVAGTGVGGYNGDNIPAVIAQLHMPDGIAVDKYGNLYIADGNNNLIRKVDGSGIMQNIVGNTIASYSGDGGPATAAGLNAPEGIAFDSSGNLYVADFMNNRIRKVTPAGIICTIAGTGVAGFSGDGTPATASMINHPRWVAIDKAQNIYISDEFNHRIRKVDNSGKMTTVAGTGTSGYNGDGIPATAATLYYPTGLAADEVGNIFIADFYNYRIRKVSAGIITTVAGVGINGASGDDSAALNAKISRVAGVTVDPSNNIYLADCDNNKIRMIDNSGKITTIAGSGIGGYGGDGGLAIFAELKNPASVAIDHSGNIYIADFDNNRVRLIKNAVSVNSVEKPSITTIDLHPNPSNGSFTINVSSQTNELLPATIINALGQTVKELSIKTNQPNEIKTDLPSGIYTISIATPKGSVSCKVEVMR